MYADLQVLKDFCGQDARAYLSNLPFEGRKKQKDCSIKSVKTNNKKQKLSK